MKGDSVIFSCNYSGSISALQWYRQYPRSKPEFLLFITESNGTGEVPSRMSSHTTKDTKHVFLEISSVEVSDSGLYYCALQPTVTGNTQVLYKNLISTWWCLFKAILIPIIIPFTIIFHLIFIFILFRFHLFCWKMSSSKIRGSYKTQSHNTIPIAHLADQSEHTGLIGKGGIWRQTIQIKC